MRGLVEVELIEDKGQGDYMFGPYICGVFLVTDGEGGLTIAVKDGENIQRIRLGDYTKKMILKSYDETKEKEERQKALEDIGQMIRKMREEMKNNHSELTSVTEIFDTGLARIEKNVIELRGDFKEMKEKESENCLKEDKKSGFISEDALVEIVKKLTT